MFRPGRGEASYADGKRATREPGPLRRRLEGLLLIVTAVFDFRSGVEGVVTDGLGFEIGFIRAVGDPGSGELEPRDLRDI